MDEALLRACFQGDMQEVAKILEKGGNVECSHPVTGATPLHHAADRGDANLVKFLLDSGANPNRVDISGCTPLWQAIYKRNYEIAFQILGNSQTDPDAGDHGRRSPLMLAAENGKWELVTRLVERGARIHTVDSRGRTPIFV